MHCIDLEEITSSRKHKDSGHCKKVCISHNTYAHLSALNTYCKQSIFVWNRNQEMGNRKDFKEEERAFIVGMAKAGATITKIAQNTKRPRGTIATILRTFRLCRNVQIAKRSGRPLKTTLRAHRQLQRLVKEDKKASARYLSKTWSDTIKTMSESRTRSPPAFIGIQ